MPAMSPAKRRQRPPSQGIVIEPTIGKPERGCSGFADEYGVVPRGGLSLGPLNISKINYLTPPQILALYQANVPMSTVK